MSTMFRHQILGEEYDLGVGQIAHAAPVCGGTIDYFLNNTLNKFCVG